MLNNFSIQSHNLGKQYPLGEHNIYSTLRDTISQKALSLIAGGRNILSAKAQTEAEAKAPQNIWAIRNIDLEIRRNEALGLIGRNGSGKSTLLKLLSRITDPTEGYAEISGRVGAMLEVGTGFHPDMTGRENVYFSGGIIGMERDQIRRNFDEIVAFAEIDTFIDHPVKIYSSGMRARLAFAVTAFLQPEILLIDEVLGVGDIEFQRKCHQKMKQLIKEEGRTVILVSHSMEPIRELCSSALWIDQGQVKAYGEANETIDRYLFDVGAHDSESTMTDQRGRMGNGPLKLTSLRLRDMDGRPQSNINTNGEIRFEFPYVVEGNSVAENVLARIHIRDTTGKSILTFSTALEETPLPVLANSGVLVCEVPKMPLTHGDFNIEVEVFVNGILSDCIYRAGTLIVTAGRVFGQLNYSTEAGLLMCDHYWRVEA